MKKKTFKIFYSWQDDIDNKLNRFFIKDCLESVQKRINKLTTLDEADRLIVKLDHDTKDIPGIPEIANTILQKITSSDILVADLTFVSEYKNHKNDLKKISNQNVVFELGFALNVLGSQKIICLFNEAFGKPNDLLFDLHHRRWPITYKLAKSNASTKKVQKELLIPKLEFAIKNIITKVPSTKMKSSIHNPFTIHNHNDFEYLFNKLQIKLKVFLSYREQYKSYTSIIEYPRKPTLYKNYSCQFQPILIDFIEDGHDRMDKNEFDKYIQIILSDENLLPNKEDYYVDIENNFNEIELLMRTLSLISLSENKFYKKIYTYLHWLEFNGYKDVDIKMVEF